MKRLTKIFSIILTVLLLANSTAFAADKVNAPDLQKDLKFPVSYICEAKAEQYHGIPKQLQLYIRLAP
jgi:hypothetical protein